MIVNLKDFYTAKIIKVEEARIK